MLTHESIKMRILKIFPAKTIEQPVGILLTEVEIQATSKKISEIRVMKCFVTGGNAERRKWCASSS